jgi:hypothetical protein
MRPLTKSETSTLLVLICWLLVLMLASWGVSGCQPGGTKPSVFESLKTAESTITAGANTLNRAVGMGMITTDDPDYAKAYNALHQAGSAMDRAWAAYRAGELGAADSSKRLAMDSYMLVRPILTRLAETQ